MVPARSTARLTLLASLLYLGACAFQPNSVSIEPAEGVATSALTVPSAPPAPAIPGSARREFDNALSALKQQRWLQAIALFEEMVEAYPRFSGPPLNLALIYRQREQPEKAEQWFVRAVKANPGNLQAFNQFGIFLRGQGRFAEAKQQYLQALTVREDDANTHRNLAVLYDLYLGEPALALQHFQRSRVLQSVEDPNLAIWVADLEHQLAVLSTE